MISRRWLLQRGVSAGLCLSLPAAAARAAAADAPKTAPLDVTFVFVNDIHACRMGDGLSPNCAAEGKTDANLLRNIAAINAVTRHVWPDEIAGKPTGLVGAGRRIAAPHGIVVCGDITDDGGGQTAEQGEGMQLLQFSHRYQQGAAPDRVRYPVYVGLGNHDLDQDGRPPHIDWYRNELRDYVRLNHKPSVFFKPLVPADNYDEASDSYSWNWGRLHLVQAQRFAGDRNKGAADALAWLKADLQTYAADGRPVVLFQHYGWDPFSIERWDPAARTFTDTGTGTAHWWSDADRQAFAAVLKGYNVIGIFHGHEHDTPMIYRRDGIDLFKATAAYKGGFGIARVTDAAMDVVIATAADGAEGIAFQAAFSKVLS